MGSCRDVKGLVESPRGGDRPAYAQGHKALQAEGMG